MTDLDDVARHHATAARTAYADVVPPPVERLRPEPDPKHSRPGAAVAVLAGVLVAVLIVVVGLVSLSRPDPLAPAAPGPQLRTDQLLDPPLGVSVPEGWEVVGDMPAANSSSALTVAVDDGILVVSDGATRLIRSDGTWAEGVAPPEALECCEGHRLVPTPAGPVLLATSGDATWLLDSATLAWQSVSSRPSTGIVLGAAVVDGDLHVVEAAGRRGDGVSSGMTSLDLETLAWKEEEMVPLPVSVGGVTSDKERLIIAGTRQGPGNEMIGGHLAFEYTPADGWRALAEVPVSGQAPTVQWVEGAGLLAWNYDHEAALLDPSGGWRRIDDVPMDSAECYPRMSAGPNGALGQCGGLAWFDSASEQWSVIPSDPLPAETEFEVSGDAVVGVYATEASRMRVVRYPLTALLPATETSAVPKPTGTTEATGTDVTAADVKLADAFVAFATDPGPATAEALPLSPDGVRLGLGEKLLRDAPTGDVAITDSWELAADGYFRGYVGPFSALRALEEHVNGELTSEAGRTSNEVTVSIGPHPHCASPPVPAPPGLGTRRRVSLQPAGVESCLQWFSVDLYLDDQGQIVAVTLDLWEP